jgi:hypothetical protein
MRISLVSGVGLAALLLLLTLSAGGAVADQKRGKCTVGKAAYNISTDQFTSTSNSPVTWPNTTVRFKQGKRGCVVVHFNAAVFADDLSIIARAVLDGTAIASPTGVFLTSNDDEDLDGNGQRTHGFSFVFPDVAPGKHVLKMQWAVGTAPGTIKVFRSSVVVHHR